MVQVRIEDEWRVYQVDVNTSRGGAEVYTALNKILGASPEKKKLALQCDGQELTQNNVIKLLQNGSVVTRIRAPRGNSSRHAREDGTSGQHRLPRLPMLSVEQPAPQHGGAYPSGSQTARESSARSPRASLGLAQRSPGPPSSRVPHPPPPVPAQAAAAQGHPELWLASNSASRLNNPTGFMAFSAEQQAAAYTYKVAPSSARSKDTVNPSATDVLLTDMDIEPYQQDGLAMEDLKTWLSSYKGEVEAFNSTALHAEMRLEEVLHNTQALGDPNAVRTKVVCQLLDGIALKFGRFQRITSRLLKEVFKSIYMDPEAGNAVPYFLQYQRTLKDFLELQARNKIINSNLGIETHKSETRWRYCQRVMSKMLHMSSDTAFTTWKLVVHEAKIRRTKMLQIVKKWNQIAMVRMLHKWRHAITEQKHEDVLNKAEDAIVKNESLAERVQLLETELNNLKAQMAPKEALLDEMRKESKEANQRILVLEHELSVSQAKAKRNELVGKKYAEIAQSTFAALQIVSEYIADSANEQLDAIKYPEVPALCQEDEDVAQMVLDVAAPKIMIRWLNYCVQRASEQHPKKEALKVKVKNLGKDLCDGKELLAMNWKAFPDVGNLKMLTEVDPLRVAENVLRLIKHNTALPEEMLTAEDITEGKQELLYSMCAEVFQATPSMELPYQRSAQADMHVAFLREGVEQFQHDERLDFEFKNEPSLEKLDPFIGRVIATVTGLMREVVSAQQLARVRRDELQSVRDKIRGYDMHIQCCRIAGTAAKMDDELDSDPRFSFWKLRRHRLKEFMLPDTLDEYADAMEVLLKSNEANIERIFKHYSGDGIMGHGEFWKFLKDCKIPSKQVNREKLDLIFFECNREQEEGDDGHVALAQDDDNPDTELMPIEFTEAIVRITAAQKGDDMPEKLEKVVQLILERACKSQSEEFRKTLNDPEMKQMLSSNRDNLRKVFRYFCAADKANSKAAAANQTMNFRELEMLMRQCNLLGTGITPDTLKKTFTEVQEGEVQEGEGDSSSELVFTEFLELMVALGCYRYPNPYQLLYARIDGFLRNDIVRPLKGKVKGLVEPGSRSKVIKGAVPTTQIGDMEGLEDGDGES